MSDLDVIALFRKGLSCSQIAATMQQPPESVHRIVVGSWSSDTEDEKPHKAGRRKTIPDETVRRIRAAKDKLCIAEAARAYGVSTATVSRIWRGETRNEVQ